MADAPKVVGLDRQPIGEPDGAMVNQSAVFLLELLLGMARAGQVSSVVIAYTVDDGDSTEYRSEWNGPRVTMLGALTRALYALNRELDQSDTGRCGEPPSGERP